MTSKTATTHATKSIRNFDLETKQGKLFKALVMDRETLSESQITKRFGVKNPTATISVIRNRGYAIYANKRVAKNGVEVTEYKHGNASRKMVALAYKAMAAGIEV
jgi:Holliday junction resolvasome RuvABC endonuclease subunit